MSNEYDGLIGGAAPEENEYDTLLRDDANAQRSQVRASLYGAVQSNPDEFARAKQLSQATGIPADTVQRNLPAIEQNAKLNEYDEALKTAPALAKQMTNPDFAKLAHDDIDNASLLEQAVSTVTRAGRSLVAGVPELSGGAYGVLEGVARAGSRYVTAPLARNDWLPADPLGEAADFLGEIRRGQQQLAQRVAGPQDGAGFVETAVNSGFRSLGRNAPALAASVYTSNPSIALTTMAGSVAGEEFGRASDAGLSFERALTYGASQAAVEYATEKLPVSYLLKDLSAGSGFLKTLAHNIATEIPGEQVATLVQDLNEWATLRPDAPLSQYLAERPGAAAQTLIATVVASGGQVGAVKGVDLALRQIERRKQEAQAATQDADALANLTALAQASKLAQRDPQSFQQFVEAAAQDGDVQDVFVDARTLAQTLNQDGIIQLADASPAVAAQFNEALATGGDIRIPVGEYSARIATQDFAQSILPHLRTSPEAMSHAEAQVFLQNEQTEFQAEAARILEQEAPNAELQTSAQRVEQTVLDQLTQVNRFTQDVNGAYAAMMRDFYVVTSQRLGITPEEMFARYPLQITAETVAGDRQLEQEDALRPDDLANANVHPNSIEYITRDLFKGKSLKVAVNSFLKKFNGQENAFLGGKVQHSYDELFAAVLQDKARSTVAGARAMKEGMGFMSLKGSAQQFNIPEKTLARAVADITKGENVNGVLNDYQNLVNAKDTGQNGSYEQAGRTRQPGSGPDAGQPDNATTVAGGPPRDGWRDATRIRSKRTARPLTVYRGSSTELDPSHFQSGALGHATGRPSAGLGVFFSTDRNDAAQYGQVRPYNLDIRNPKTYRVEDLPGFNSAEEATAFREQLRAEGHDGVIILAKHLGGENWIVAFDPEQTIPQEPLRSTGTRNLVVFDDSLVTITHKNGQPVTQAERDAYLQGARGQISFGADITQQASTITLLKNADLSTFLHESGHFFLEVYTHIANQPGAPAAVADDMNALLKWFGVKDLATWQGMTIEQKRASHEKFARGFEAYLMEGKAPSTELNDLFARFRAWLLNVYKSLTALNVELSDEVRSVFGRMLASDQEIAAAEAARSYSALFANREQAGMTEQEWQSYQNLGAQATQDAVEKLQKRSLLDLRWLSNARSRMLKNLQKDAADKRKTVRAEVADEVNSEPLYAAIRFMSRGELEQEDQTNKQRKVAELASMVGTKLSLPALKEMYGEGPAAPWRYLSTGKHGLATAKDGLHPDLVAELFGFTSGDELVRKILAAEPANEIIDARTDLRMLEKYGDLTDQTALERAVDLAVHNEARSKFVAAELRALDRSMQARQQNGTDKRGRPKSYNVLDKAAREFAAQTIARKRVKDVRPAQFAAAETRAAKATVKALAAGKTEEAAMEKRNQLINTHATRAAHEALAEIDSGLTYLKKFGRDAVRKNLDTGYVDQIDALLERFDLRRGVSDKEAAKRQSLVKWVEAQQAAGFEPTIDEDLLNEARRKPYRELTVEEFRGLVDAVRNIEHLARLKKKLLTAKDEREFGAAVDAAEKVIRDNGGKPKPDKLESNTFSDRLQSGVTELFAMHRKFASLVREMDGFRDGGTLWDLFVRPMNAAGDKEAGMREKATMRLYELFKPIMASGQKLSHKTFIPAIGKSLSREGRIAVALNMGNETNRQRILDGERWAPAQLQAVLDTVTKEEWDFAQGVWDYIDTYWSEIAEKERRVSGISPEKVKAAPVQTQFGEYKGGYYPIKYDPNRSSKAEADTMAEFVKQAMQGLYTRATTRRGHTKARVDTVQRPVRKDLGVIFEHVEQVIHDLSWHEYLIDANRLLRAGQIDEAIREHYGPEVLRVLRKTLDDVAVGETAAQNVFERSINYLRTGASIAGLGWNLATSLLQPIGLTQSMVRIGPKYVARGLSRWLRSGSDMQDSVAWIYSKSDFMRLRGKTMQREINEIRNRVNGNKMTAVQESYFWLIQKGQMLADVPTWLGAYEKEMEQTGDEAKAVELADQAVLDAQGGGQIKDLAGIQRGGPLMKLWTNFYSFFNTTYNLSAESVRRTDFRKASDVGRLAVDFLLLYTVPALLATVLKDALKGDDDDDLLEKVVRDQLSYMLGTMVGLRELGSAIGGFDYQGAAGQRFFSEASKLIKQAEQGEIDAAALKALNNVAGILFHYPAGQVQRTAEGINALANGDTRNPGVLISGT